MKLAILYEDDSVFVSMTPDEFVKKMEKLTSDGLSVKESMKELIKEIKHLTLTK